MLLFFFLLWFLPYHCFEKTKIDCFSLMILVCSFKNNRWIFVINMAIYLQWKMIVVYFLRLSNCSDRHSVIFIHMPGVYLQRDNLKWKLVSRGIDMDRAVGSEWREEERGVSRGQKTETTDNRLSHMSRLMPIITFQPWLFSTSSYLPPLASVS